MHDHERVATEVFGQEAKSSTTLFQQVLTGTFKQYIIFNLTKITEGLRTHNLLSERGGSFNCPLNKEK
jgi:hypothetical protein